MLEIVARALALVLGCQVNGDSLSLTVKLPTHVPLQESEIWQALKTMGQPDFFSTKRMIAVVWTLPRERLSKFQPLLPPDLEAQFLAERLFDIAGLRESLTEGQITSRV